MSNPVESESKRKRERDRRNLIIAFSALFGGTVMGLLALLLVNLGADGSFSPGNTLDWKVADVTSPSGPAPIVGHEIPSSPTDPVSFKTEPLSASVSAGPVSVDPSGSQPASASSPLVAMDESVLGGFGSANTPSVSSGGASSGSAGAGGGGGSSSPSFGGGGGGGFMPSGGGGGLPGGAPAVTASNDSPTGGSPAGGGSAGPGAPSTPSASSGPVSIGPTTPLSQPATSPGPTQTGCTSNCTPQSPSSPTPPTTAVNNPQPPTAPTTPGPQQTAGPGPSTNAPGSTPQNPISPATPTPPGNPVTLPIASTPNQWQFFDPPVAIGFNYQLNPTSGQALTFGITKIMPTTSVGSGIYDLWLYDVVTNTWVDSSQFNGGNTITIDADPSADTSQAFDVVQFLDGLTQAQDQELGVTDPADGLTQFSLRDIDPAAKLNPDDPNDFVTGLYFTGTINGDLIITPLAIDSVTGLSVDPPYWVDPIPEPGTAMLLSPALIAFGWWQRRRQRG